MAVAQAQHALREMVDSLKKMVLKYLCHTSGSRKNARSHECAFS